VVCKTSTIPVLGNSELLIIIDARDSVVQEIIDKLEAGVVPTAVEIKM
jgi:hypothetical protein